ncbi:MAG: transposase family protein [Chloroflexi bacterium]|nr:MAG: transposase family protein [Chloroflexota bacterium]
MRGSRVCACAGQENGKAKEAWFRTFLELPNGIPSHGTFGARRRCSIRRSSRPAS